MTTFTPVDVTGRREVTLKGGDNDGFVIYLEPKIEAVKAANRTDDGYVEIVWYYEPDDGGDVWLMSYTPPRVQEALSGAPNPVDRQRYLKPNLPL